jgi:hypothetical protein
MSSLFAERPLQKALAGILAVGLASSAALASAQGNQQGTDGGQQVSQQNQQGQQNQQSGQKSNQQGENQQKQSRQQRDVDWDMRFQEVDADNNNATDWAELEAAYNQQLNQVDWNERQVLDRFDASDDGILDENEYLFFITSLERNILQSQSGNQQRQASTGDNRQN